MRTSSSRPHSQKSSLRAAASRYLRSLQMESLEGRALLASVTLTAIADATLYQDSNGRLANGAGDTMVVGRPGAGNDLRRGILRFDVSSAVPANAQIDSVSLQVTQLNSSSSAQDLQLRRVLQPWTEGTLNAGADFETGISENPLLPTGSVTWRFTSYRTTSWLRQGGLFEDNFSDEQTIRQPGAYTFSSAQMANDVRAWRGSPNSQYGWMILPSDETASTDTPWFATREAADTESRPKLTIEYSVVTNHPPVAQKSLDDQFLFTDQPFSYTVPADTFLDTDPNQTLNYSASRPDFSALPDWLLFDPRTRSFSGTPTAADAERIQVRVTASDTGVPVLNASADFTLDVLLAGAPWTNIKQVGDVDGDGLVVPLDALLIINELNFPTFIDPQTGALPAITNTLRPPPFLDVDGDNFCVPVDALIVINILNQSSSGEGEEALAYPAHADWLDLLAADQATSPRSRSRWLSSR
ncbi:MAG: DNRLRE domain-containing protein [Planctomycetota bacterium]